MAASLPHRALLALTGPDTIALLERIVTCSTADWDEGALRYGALLTPQGKVVADFLALRTAQGVLLDAHREAIPVLQKKLKLFRLRADVEIEPAGEMGVGLGAEGAPDPRSPALSRRVYARRDAGVLSNGDGAQAAAREAILACAPEWGRDFGDADVFPADVNMDLLNGVDLHKGCFVGQEVVSRMHRRGKTRKRTLVLRGEGLSTGDPVTLDGAALGEVTSVSGDAGLARLRIDRLGPAREVDAGAVAARIEAPDWLEAEIAALANG